MLRLILSNIRKHRLLYVLVGVLFLLLAFYLTIGINILNSVENSLISAVSQNLSGDLIVVPQQADRVDLLTKDGETKVIPLERWQDLDGFLGRQPGVLATSPRLRVWGTLQTDLNRIPIILIGVIPDKDRDVLPGRVIDQGKWLEGDQPINLYFRHSDLLSANLGDAIGITTTTVAGYSHLEVATLTGILDYRDLDAYTDYAFFGFVPLDFLTALRQTSEPVVGEILVRLQDNLKRDALAAALEKEFPGKYRIVDPAKSSALVYGVSTLTRFCILAVGGILLLLVLLSSAFLINVSLESRRHEIGIYQAMGIPNGRIAGLLGGELLIVTLTFGLLGIAIGHWFLEQFLADGIEATIVPLKLILGRKVVLVPSPLSTDGWVLVVLAFAFLGNLWMSLRHLETLNPIDTLRED